MRIALIIFNVASAGSALIAAVYWFLSARTALPAPIAYFDRAPASDLFYAALQQGTTFNRTAAAFAAVSALCAAVSAILGIFDR